MIKKRPVSDKVCDIEEVVVVVKVVFFVFFVFFVVVNSNANNMAKPHQG